MQPLLRRHLELSMLVRSSLSGERQLQVAAAVSACMRVFTRRNRVVRVYRVYRVSVLPQTVSTVYQCYLNTLVTHRDAYYTHTLEESGQEK